MLYGMVDARGVLLYQSAVFNSGSLLSWKHLYRVNRSHKEENMDKRNSKPFFRLASLSTLGLMMAATGSAQAALVTIPNSALNSSPGVYTPGGYYTNDLGPNIVTTGGGNAANVGQPDGRNDDGFMALDLGFDVSFFGNTYSSLYINNNGNVSFGEGIASYIPSGPTGANAPVISPFFGDVDTRPPESGVVHYNLDGEQLVVTWDDVGFFNENAPPTNSFQLVLRGGDFTVPAGEGSIGFFFETMGWDDTDTNDVAASGFGDGSGNGTVLEGSVEPGLNNIVQNQYIWFDADLDVVPPTGEPPTEEPPVVSEPGTLSLFALSLVAAGIASRRKTRKG